MNGKAYFGAQPFDVIEVEYIRDDGDPGSDYGQADINRCEIRVRQDLAPSVKASTVCHEALHVLLQIAGMKAKGDFFASGREEEQFVCRMEPHFHAFIVQNRGLILQIWQAAGIEPED